MDFYWERGKVDQLVLSGEIKTGDGEKFRSFLRQNFEKYRSGHTIRLASNGGNLVESLKIAGILRSVYPTIVVKGDKCASSCFFLYLSGVKRTADAASLIGVHRAFFEPVYFEKLKPEDARKQQSELTKVMDTILDENQVPRYLRDRINHTSSADIYWLTDDDVENIGYMPAWYEEVMIAKCEYGKVLAYSKLPNDEFDPQSVVNYYIYRGCEDKFIDVQLATMPTSLAESGSSIKNKKH